MAGELWWQRRQGLSLIALVGLQRGEALFEEVVHIE
jgi:hypothetical protein